MPSSGLAIVISIDDILKYISFYEGFRDIEYKDVEDT